MRQESVVLVSGRDPAEAGGHESYVRAHALAARQLGYEPHVFCIARQSSVSRTRFAVVHRVGPRVPVALQQRVLARAVVRFLDDPEHDAMLVEPGDVEQLSAALTKLLESPALRRALGANACRSHLERFSSECFVAALGELYGQLGSEARAGGSGRAASAWTAARKSASSAPGRG